MASFASDISRRELTLADKVRAIQWGLVLLIALISSIGFAMLYSAANGNLQPWASRQMTRFAIALVPMIAAGLIDVRYWFRSAYWIYGASLVLLIAVDLLGTTGLGAQRWIDLGFMQLQPSEFMKIALVLALARYFHSLSNETAGQLSRLIIPALMVGVPAALVLKQPDLGTAMMLCASGAVLFYLGGVRLWVFAAGALATAAAAPLAWLVMRDYQKTRLTTFLDPDRDPLGAGYHILQSKIALGSGGVYGKGFLLGTQSHLSFLPEKQTDFIFTMLAEEFPLVGVPLPLISYGGSAMVTVMFGFGLVMNVGIHRDVRISRQGESRLG